MMYFVGFGEIFQFYEEYFLQKSENLSPNAFFSAMKKYFSSGFDFTIKSIPIESQKIISDIVWAL